MPKVINVRRVLVFQKLVLVAVFALTVLLLPPKTFASSGQVGTHVGYGDTTKQIDIINAILSKSPPANYPITIMVNIGATSDEISKLASALDGGSFSVAIRVLGITTNTSSAEVERFAGQINAITWNQVKKPIVVFGNELNSYQGNEWGGSKPGSVEEAGAIYAPLLDTLARTLDTGKFDLAGVALDPYNTESGKNLATAFTDISANAFSNPTVNSFATNAYEGVSSPLGDGIEAGLGLYAHLAGISPKTRKIFTEFGVDPKNKDAKQHLSFYKNYEKAPIPGDFEFATALVPNLCSKSVDATNQWYFYILGKIYNQNLQEISENCTPVEEGGTFIYPGPVDIYYNSPGDVQQKAARFSDAIANDYLLTCSPQIQFKPELQPSDPKVVLNLSGKKALVNLVEHCSTNGTDNANCLFNVGDQSVSVLADGSSIPLIRSDRTGRTSSFEGFFSSDIEGLADTNDPNRSMLLTAPSAKLMPREKTCEGNISFLKAVETTCNSIPVDAQGKIVFGATTQQQTQEKYYKDQKRDFNSCGLDTKLQDTRLTQILNDVRGQGFGGNEADYCYSDAFSNPTVDQERLAKLVMQVQPVTPNAYRIGYLVIYISAKEEDLTSQKMITRITRPMDANYLRNIFKIVPVLIPANFGAEKEDTVRNNQGETIQGAAFDGVLKRTITPILPAEMQIDVQNKAQENKNAVRGKMAEFGGETVNDTGMVWLPYCNNPKPYSASGLDLDDTVLNCNFADYINANLNLGSGNIMQHPEQLAPCRFYEDKTGGETAEVLNSPLKPEWQSGGFTAYSKKDPSPSIKVNGQIYVSRDSLANMINEEDAKLRVFLAVPESEFGLIKDYEKYLFQALIGKDSYDAVLEEMKTSDDPLRTGVLRMTGVQLRVTGGASHFFTSPTTSSTQAQSQQTQPQNAQGTPGATPAPGTPIDGLDVEATFGVQGDANPVLWGGWLSRFAYTYTANIITPQGTKSFAPFDLAIRKLEPYWLNGVSGGDTGSGQTIACMNVWVDKQTAQEHADFIRDNIENQRTYWKNYFSGYRYDPVRVCKDGNSLDPSLYDTQATQYLFESPPECGGLTCYEYIIQRTLARQGSDGKVVDPYIAMSIALNENGGLKTSLLDRSGQHFGVITPIQGHIKECSDDVVYLGSINEKLEIMLGTLLNDHEDGKEGTKALQEYGYADGGSDMIRLTKLLSKGNYSPECQ